MESYALDLTKAEKEMNDKIAQQEAAHKEAENKIKRLEAQIADIENIQEDEDEELSIKMLRPKQLQNKRKTS
jgi:hypothetical protein